MATISHFVGTEELSIEKCWCGVTHAVPSALAKMCQMQRDEGRPQQGIYCPLGHSWIYGGKNKLAEAEKKIQLERAAHDQTKAAQREAELRIQILEKKQSNLKKRIANGICPCCHRTVKQLAAHIKTKHPEYSATRPVEVQK